jgi:ubiquinone biosynthesis protein
MDLFNLNQHREEGKRLAEIVQILTRYGLADWLVKIPLQSVRDLLATRETQAIADMPVAERLRLALTEMGTTYIKLGQVLSTRADLVGPDIAEELRKLQADTPADPPEIARQTLEEELGKSPEELFTEFEPTAFSSASIGQVHRARLADGQQVVLKVQHAGIQEKVRIDLNLLEKLAKLLQEYVPEARNYQPVATTRGFRRTLLRELDFTCERSNMERFTRNFAKDPTVHIPTAYKEFSSKRVLTMELLDGTPGSKPEKLSEAGVDLNELARNAANIFLNMIFRDGFYHADPHPGNFIVLDGGVVGLLDCGMVGQIDDSTRELFEDLLLMLMQHDAEGLSDTLLRAGSAPADVDRVAFRADVSDLLVEYGSQSLEEFDLGGALDQLSGIVRRHRVVMPSAASLLIKTLVMLEGTARLLSPTFSLNEVIAPFKNQLIRSRLDPKRWMRRLQQSMRDVDRLVRNGPRNVADILDRAQSGKLQMKHEVNQLELVANRLVGGLLIASLFVGSAMLLSHNVPPLASGVSILGGLGFLAAVVIGTRMLWHIRKDLR